MISRHQEHSYSIPLIISIILHSIILFMLLCALYTHEQQERQDSAQQDLQKSPQNVLFYPLPQSPINVNTPTAGSPAQTQQQSATPTSASAIPDDSSPEETEEITTQATTAAHIPPPYTEDVAPPQTTPTSLALPLKAEQPVLAMQDKSITPAPAQSQPHTSHAKKKATQKLAQISNSFFSNVQQATEEQEAEYSNTHVAQHQLNTSVEQRYYAKIWQALKMSFDAHKKSMYLGNNVDTRATLQITLTRDGKLLGVSLSHARRTAEINTIEETLRSAARAVGLFPPVPRVFSDDPFIMKLPLQINTHAGYHTYDLVYNGSA